MLNKIDYPTSLKELNENQLLLQEKIRKEEEEKKNEAVKKEEEQKKLSERLAKIEAEKNKQVDCIRGSYTFGSITFCDYFICRCQQYTLVCGFAIIIINHRYIK